MRKFLSFVIVLLLAVTATYAQEKKDEAKPIDSSVARIKLANELAKYGYETYSASALIEAAQILSQVQTQGMGDIKYEQGKGTNEKSDKATEGISVQKLIKDAKELMEL